MKKYLLLLMVAITTTVFAYSYSESKTNQATTSPQIENLYNHIEKTDGLSFSSNNRQCPKCHGYGYFQCRRCNNNGWIKCRTCRGQGAVNGSQCDDCYGRGFVECDYPGCYKGHITCTYCDGEGYIDD